MVTLSILALMLGVFMTTLAASSTRYKQPLVYQARITGSDNIPLADGTYSIKFAIYTATTGSASCVWRTGSGDTSGTCTGGTSGAISVVVSRGLFSVPLGDTTYNSGTNMPALALDFQNSTYYIGVTLGSDAEMTPRTQIGGASYSYNSDLFEGYATSTFAVLGGITGGQSLTGGTASSQNLFLRSTSNATLGSVIVATSTAFQLNPYGASAGNTAEIRMLELLANGTNYSGFKPTNALASSTIYILPATGPAAGQVLSASAWDDSSSTLSWANALLTAGLAGGQTITGGTAASETITFRSTAHGTKGKILFGSSVYDEANNRLGLGTTTPSSALDIQGTLRLSGATAGYLSFAAPATVTTSTAFTLPLGDGTNGQFLSTNGAGTLAWSSAVLTAGLSGGQTIIGSTAASENLFLRSTSNATLGSVIVATSTAFQLNPYGASAGNTAEIRMLELLANGTNYAGFRAPDALGSNTIYVLPTTDPTAGQVLSATAVANSSSTLSWVAAPESATVFAHAISSAIGLATAVNLTDNSGSWVHRYNSTNESSAQYACRVPTGYTGLASIYVYYVNSMGSASNLKIKYTTARMPYSLTTDISTDTNDAYAAYAAATTATRVGRVLAPAAATNGLATPFAAGDLLHIKVFRDDTDGATDTYVGNWDVLGVECNFN